MEKGLRQYQFLFIEPRGRKITLQEGTSPKDCIERYFAGDNITIEKTNQMDREANVVVKLLQITSSPTNYYRVTGYQPDVLLNKEQFELLGMLCISNLESIKNPAYTVINKDTGKLKSVNHLVDTYLNWVIDCNKGILPEANEQGILQDYLRQKLHRKKNFKKL